MEDITVDVKFGGRTISLSVSPDVTVKAVKLLLQPLTDVLPRGQKLIFKGKVLSDGNTLRLSQVSNGSKIMLMASQGLHQGVIPNEVWPCGASTRVLDLGNNSIRDIPSKIGTFCSIQRLLLNANDIVDGSITWEGLSLLKSLTHLSLSENHLTVLPPELGSLTSLKQLDVTNNKLGSLPSDIEFLKKLEVLNVSSNRITIVPVSIGSCNSLTEIDLSSNLLKELPETIGNLQHLKALHLSNNGLKKLPSALFKMCLQLSTLDLHNTEITMDVLRDFEGWKEFDERRRLKHQKQLDFRVVGSAEFDEGADKN